MFFISLLTVFTVHAADFPDCENIFVPLDEMIASPEVNLDAAKKSLFKISNDKRMEVLRYVRTEKDAFRKNKDSELIDFDVESKKNKTATSDEKNKRRKEREELNKKISADKKEFNKELDEKQKICNTYLNSMRSVYLDKFRNIKNAPRATNHNKDIDGANETLESLTAEEQKKKNKPDLSEFDEIPKGKGTVLKPQ
jgi:hypothetical protein